MILKMENYKYPTREEWLTISRTFPKIGRFGFSFIDEMNLLMEGEKSIREVYVLQNLSQWDNYLGKKIWNLRQSYVNTMVNYNRGIASSNEDFNDEVKVIQLFQFEFYSETTFYYLISVRDIVLQIVNLAFELKLKEREVNPESIKKRVKNNALLEEIVENLFLNLKESNDIRNSMAHKFSKLKSDYRGSVSDDERTYSAGRGDFIDYTEQINILQNSLDTLNTFCNSIKIKLQELYSLKTD